ncbi:phage tail protein [Nostoc sp. FACHB-152]|uniref:phage tail protein n=1 Tax=unclassified Nostoc TaxID=2593658 RepID=UPI001689D2A8|nr:MULTISPECIES: phage tail protein [unclassified Nostoc]MBD2449729.1 phage tail protein [Nostoc sp. FACHB-152]MBD2469894.1 phage tail protein [Nostoc sp. FACHB-145]
MFSNSNIDDKYTQHSLNFVTSNRFYVEIDSSIMASFTECSGPSVQIEKEVYHEGGVNNQQRVFLGHTTFSDITFKRGITDDQSFFNWLCEIFDEQQETTRCNVNILVFNQAGDIMQSWTLIGAIPTAWKASDFNADGSTVAIEELTMSFEGLSIGQDAGGGNRTTRNEKQFFSSS